MKFRLRTTKSLAVLCGSLAAIAASQANAQTVLQFNRWIPPSHFLQAELFEGWAQNVAKATNGRVKVVMTAASLGAPPRQYDLAAEGVADVTWNGHGYTPGRFPLTEYVELPFLGQSAEAISVAYWRTYTKLLLQAGEHNDVKLLALHTQPAGHVYNNVRPIGTISDFVGLKIRANNQTTAKFLKDVGAVPLFMSVTEMRDGLSKGILDGTVFTDEAFVNFKVDSFVKHALKVPGGLYNTSFFMVLNKKKWEALAAADQNAVMSVSGESFARWAGKVWDEKEAAGTKALQARGVAFRTANAQLLNDMKKHLARYENDWVAQAKQRGVDGAAVLRAFKAEIANYRRE